MKKQYSVEKTNRSRHICELAHSATSGDLQRKHESFKYQKHMDRMAFPSTSGSFSCKRGRYLADGVLIVPVAYYVVVPVAGQHDLIENLQNILPRD